MFVTSTMWLRAHTLAAFTRAPSTLASAACSLFIMPAKGSEAEKLRNAERMMHKNRYGSWRGSGSGRALLEAEQTEAFTETGDFYAAGRWYRGQYWTNSQWNSWYENHRDHREGCQDDRAHPQGGAAGFQDDHAHPQAGAADNAPNNQDVAVHQWPQDPLQQRVFLDDLFQGILPAPLPKARPKTRPIGARHAPDGQQAYPIGARHITAVHQVPAAAQVQAAAQVPAADQGGHQKQKRTLTPSVSPERIQHIRARRRVDNEMDINNHDRPRPSAAPGQASSSSSSSAAMGQNVTQRPPATPFSKDARTRNLMNILSETIASLVEAAQD